MAFQSYFCVIIDGVIIDGLIIDGVIIDGENDLPVLRREDGVIIDCVVVVGCATPIDHEPHEPHEPQGHKELPAPS